MTIEHASDAREWDAFLTSQTFRPFLQSWTMGEVYADVGQEPVRLIARDEGGAIRGVCFAHLVPARRGRHLSVPYGPVVADRTAVPVLLEELSRVGGQEKCGFLRLSPFWTESPDNEALLRAERARPSPLHLLGEKLWYLPLVEPDPWAAHEETAANGGASSAIPSPRTDESLLADMRKTTRNLIRRAEREGVEVSASENPERDIDHFLRLHEETRQRHGFTPYTTAFFRTQVRRFAAVQQCSLYLARYQGDILAASIHMHIGQETSYHHGASTLAHRNIPASYLLQWRAVQDSLKRGDRIYNFWGIAPPNENGTARDPTHPFAGVTLFKTGFGGRLLSLVHSHDIPLSSGYALTRAFEFARKWKRGF
jgi:lipid II:glycine glycyltransferase (peptidoglycan interpeptide bridge formation enzyme)